MSMPFNFPNPLAMQVNKLDNPDVNPGTTTAQQVVADNNAPVEAKTKTDAKVKKRNGEFRSRIDICKIYRRKLIPNWTTSIDYRRGKPFTSQTDEDQVAVNLDWSMTKAKQAQLFSQVPEIRLVHGNQTLPKSAPWASNFQVRLNDGLIEAGIESAMDECLPDCINAAGIGAILVSYEALTENRDVPSMDMSTLPPEVHAQVLQTGKLDGEDIPMESIPHPVDQRYVVQRISPADLLWPINFTGANFDNATWIGRSGRITWTEAMNRFGLSSSEKDSVLGEDRTTMDKLTHDVERDKTNGDDMVGFDEIWYKEFQYDETAKSFSTIHHLVFVGGKEDPVVDAPWEGQKVGPDGMVVGAQKFPMRILTLTYITDESIPPSDSAIGRPQVNEINKARTQMIKQRERSLPVRWFDVNRIDPAIQQGLMRGTWQAMIPVQGEGSRVIGEVARATMPQENFLFDKVAKTDLDNEWGVGFNQSKDENKDKKDESAPNMNAQVGRERAKVASFVVGIAEVLGGLMCLYEDPGAFGDGFDPSLSKVLKYSILADSTVLLEAGQRLARLNSFVNTYAKSGWVNLEPVLQEIATLAGLDPATVIRAPMPKPPVEPNISLRLTGVEDLLTPMALAFMIKSGQAPSADNIEQAKTLIQQSVVPPQPPPGVDPSGMPSPLGAPPMGQGAPLLGPLGAPPPPGAPPPGAPIPAPAPGLHPGTPVPAPPPPKIGEANPQMAALEAITKRSQGGQG